MDNFRVIIDTLKEQYLYELEALHDEDAENQAVENAKQDGMDEYDWYHVTVEYL